MKTMGYGRALMIAIAASALVVLAGCPQKEGPGERAGKSVDKAMDKAGDKIERAGEKIEKAGESVRDAAQGDKK